MSDTLEIFNTYIYLLIVWFLFYLCAIMFFYDIAFVILCLLVGLCYCIIAVIGVFYYQYLVSVFISIFSIYTFYLLHETFLLCFFAISNLKTLSVFPHMLALQSLI